jgi:leishmanolysin
MKLILLLFVLTCIINIGLTHNHPSHECIHDDIQFPPKKDENNEFLGKHNNDARLNRVLTAQAWQKIRIAVDYTALEGIDNTTLEYIQDTFFPNVIDYFESSLNVIQLSPSMTIPQGTSCYTYTVPQNYTVDADLMLFVTYSNNASAGWVAWATACTISGVNNRPIVGQVNLNLALFNSSLSKYQTLVVMHETTHVLAFNKGLWPFFINSTTNTPLGQANVIQNVNLRGSATQVVVTPKVKALAQAYYGCNNYPGLELENQGSGASAGSHWESRVLADDIMVAAARESNVYSPFTAALLEDSGWYQFNYNYTKPTQWGRGRGCNFVNNYCIQNSKAISSEFCSNLGYSGCSFNARYKALCYTTTGTPSNANWYYFGARTISGDPFQDNCPVMTPYGTGDCKNQNNQINQIYFDELYGDASLCFQGTFVKNQYAMYAGYSNYGCFETKCSVDGKGKYQLSVKIGKYYVACPQAGGSALVTDPSYQGSVTCPPAQQVCILTCPKNCSGNGDCINGVCQCFGSWIGEDCSSLSWWWE